MGRSCHLRRSKGQIKCVAGRQLAWVAPTYFQEPQWLASSRHSMNACYRWCSATLPKSFNLRYPFLHHSTAAQQGLKAGVLTSSLSPHFLLMSANSASGSTCHRQPSVYLFPLTFCISLLRRTFLRCALRQRFSNAKTSYQQLSAVKKQTYQVIQEGEVGGSCAFHSAVLLFKHLQGVYSLEGECLKLLLLSYSSIQRLG